MRVLLDEDMPRRLARELVGHEVRTVPEMGWASIANGALIQRAVAAGFEVLLTADRNMPYQQNVPSLGLALVAVAARDTRVETMRPSVPEVLAVLAERPQPGTVVVVGSHRARR